MQHVTRKPGNPSVQVEAPSSNNTGKRFSDNEYDRLYLENLGRSGYCHKLPLAWREHVAPDSVLWFANEGTEFQVGSAFDAATWSNLDKEDLDMVGLLWFMVCCPIQPSQITRDQTNKYWEGIKSILRPEPKYPRFVDYIKVQELPSIDEHLKDLAMPFSGIAMALRFQPQYQILSTMSRSTDPFFDRWVAENLVTRQISYQVFCSAATRQLFQSLRDRSHPQK